MRLLIVTQAVDKKNQVLGFFVDWIVEFSKNFSSVTVICLEKGDFDPILNVNVLSLGKESGVSKIKYLYRFYKYIFIQRNNYDAVFVHMNPIYLIFGGLVWRILGKKIGLWYTHKHVDLKLRIATFFSHVIFSASKESFRLKTKKLVVTGHGIPINLFSQNTTNKIGNPIKLIIVGRISPVKQTEKAVYILKELNKKADATLTIVGGPTNSEDLLYLDKVKATAQKLGVFEKIHFLGHIPFANMFSILKEHDIMLHTSQTGSIDKVVLEALLSSTLVITESEAFKLDFESRGMFVDGKIEQFVEKTLALKENTSLQDDIRRFGREWVVLNHSLSSLIPKIRSIYEKN